MGGYNMAVNLVVYLRVVYNRIAIYESIKAVMQQAMVNLTTFHVQKCINSWGCHLFVTVFPLYSWPVPTWAKLHCAKHVQATYGGKVACVHASHNMQRYQQPNLRLICMRWTY